MEGSSSWNDDSKFPSSRLSELTAQQQQQLQQQQQHQQQQSTNATEEVLVKLLHALQSSNASSQQTSQTASSLLGPDRGRTGSFDIKSLVPKATSLASQYSEAYPHFSSVPQSPSGNKAQQSAALDDGHEWRKYGQKQAKGATFPRAYYRCAVHGCPAKKTVEKMADGFFDILYKEEHDHSEKRAQGKSRNKVYEEIEHELRNNSVEEFAGFSPCGSIAGSETELQENLQAALLQEAIFQVKAASAQQAAAAYLAQSEARTQSASPAQQTGFVGDLFDMISNQTGQNPPQMHPELPPQPEIELPTARSMGAPESLRVTPKFGEFLPLPPLKMENRPSGFPGMFPPGPLGPPPQGQLSRQASNQGGISGFNFMNLPEASQQIYPDEKPHAEDWDLGAVVGQSLSGRSRQGIQAIPVGPPVVAQWQNRAGWDGVQGSMRSEPTSPLSGSWSPAGSSFSNFSTQFDDLEVSSGIVSSLSCPQSPVKRKETMGAEDFDAALSSLMSGDITLKKRRMVPVHRRTVKVPLEGEDALEDGYKWRKYGKKVIKDTPFERSYFRCTKEGCEARKRVERSQNERDVLLVTYEGQHTHNPSLFKARVRQSREEDSMGGQGQAGGAYSSMVGAIASLAVKSEPSSPSRAGAAWQNRFGAVNPFSDVGFHETKSLAEAGRISDVQFEKDLKELSKFNLRDLGFDE